MSDSGPARTMFASKAMEMHTLFAVKFKDTKVGDKVPRRVLVQEVDVESTGGGQLAKMSITLVPENQSGHNLVCGWIDVASNQVRMRSYATLAAMFKAQTSRFFDLPEAQYQTFVTEAQDFVTSNGFSFEVYDEATKYGKPSAGKPPQAGKNSATLLIVAGVIVLAIVAGVLIKFVL